MEHRRTSMRLREPAAKLKEEAKAEAQPMVKSNPVGRPKGSKKAKIAADHVSAGKSKVKETSEPKANILVIPNKLADDQPLPSLPTLQSRKLKDTEWQSVVDSGVLVASLPRSRQRWLHGGMFETYWSKSTYKKKKELLHQAGNKGPLIKEGRPSMTKIGTCKMVVEPHIFDVTLFVIKDTNAHAPPTQQSKSTAPYVPGASTSQKLQHHHHIPAQVRPYSPGTAKPLYPAPTPGPPHTVVTQPAYGPPTTNGSPAPLHMQAAHSYQHPTTTATPTAVHQSMSASSSANIQPAGSSQSWQTATANTPSNRAPTAPKPPAQNGAPDPVIQMLAQRAQHDHALKQVMKLVAGGQATQAQLNYFQSHIDELTKMVKQRQEEEKRKQSQQQQQASIAAATPHSHSSTTSQSTGTSSNYPPAQQQHAPHPRPLYHQPPVPVQPRPPRPTHIPAPLHVLLEFSQNAADRFLFPRDSILEFDARGTSLLASFLVVKTQSELLSPAEAARAGGVAGAGGAEMKRGKKAKVKMDADAAGTTAVTGVTNGVGHGESAIGAGAVAVDIAPAESAATATDAKAKAETTKLANTKAVVTPADTDIQEKQFYQPVSVRFESPSDTTLFTAFSRVVAPVDQVQKHMLDIASRAERIPFSYLAMRLPRESQEIVL